MANARNQDFVYGADQIQVLEGLEAVRRRPGMYIGGTDAKALHHMVFEVVDNAIDEAMQGRCDQISITIHKDESVTVSDNGAGIPVDIQKQTGLPAVTVVMTKLHAGGKFGGGGYKVSGGLHGVGVSAVNALSTWMETTVRRNGKVYRQRFERGVPVTDVEVVGKCSPDETGTTQTFPTPTASTGDIIKAISPKLPAMFIPGRRYKKSGVVFFGLESTSHQQLQLFSSHQDDSRKERLAAAMDDINRHYGRGTLFNLAEGISRPWSMRRERLSPSYTTSWKQLLQVK